MTINRFLVRPTLLPDESLWSYLTRLASENGYRTASEVAAAWRVSLPNTAIADDLHLPMQAVSYKMLARMTGLDPQAIWGSTLHRFAKGMLTPSDLQIQSYQDEKKWLLGHPYTLIQTTSMVGHQIRSPLAAAYCPLCLRERPYHRVIWQPLSTTICERHHCRLVDRCPSCGHIVDISEITHGCCRNCQTIFAASISYSVALDSLEFQSQIAIRSLVQRDGSELVWKNIAGSDEPIVLNAIYHVLLGIRDVFMADTCRLTKLGFELPRHSRRLRRGSLTPEVNGTLLSASYQALQDWPHGFHRFLDAVGGSYGYDLRLSAFNPFYVRHFVGSWQHWTFQFIQDAFQTYAASDPSLERSLQLSIQRRDSTASQSQYMTLVEAAFYLGITPAAVHRLVQQGALKRSNGSQAHTILLKRTEVEGLKVVWNDLLTPIETASILGCSIDTLFALVENRHLAFSTSIGCKSEVVTAFSTRRVRAFILGIRRRAVYKDDSDARQWLSLLSLPAKPDGNSPSISRVIDAVFAGQVALSTDKNSWGLVGIYVLADDLAYLSLIEREDPLKEKRRFDQEPGLLLGKLTEVQAARLLEVSLSAFRVWAAHGMLKPIFRQGSLDLYSEPDVKRFREEYLGVRQVAQLLHVSRLTVEDWVRFGQLRPASGPGVDSSDCYLFRRTDVLLGRRRR